MTEEGVVAEAEVQPVPDMGDTPGGVDGGASEETVFHMKTAERMITTMEWRAAMQNSRTSA